MTRSAVFLYHAGMSKTMASLRSFLSVSLAAMAGFALIDGARAEDAFQIAAADCYSIGLEVAQQNGGTLARASQITRNDETLCVIVVLVPGRDGERPRRAEFEVPTK